MKDVLDIKILILETIKETLVLDTWDYKLAETKLAALYREREERDNAQL